jgi:hypothetical protein
MPSPQPPKPTIAIAGATGDLGRHLTHAFLTLPDLAGTYAQVVLLVRQEAAGEMRRRWERVGNSGGEVGRGAEGVEMDENVGKDGVRMPEGHGEGKVKVLVYSDGMSEREVAGLMDGEGVDVLVNAYVHDSFSFLFFRSLKRG